MPQKVFAEKIGKPASEVSDILSGDRNLTIDTMTDIERVLDMRLLDTTLFDSCIIKKECTQNVTATKHYKSYSYATVPVKLEAHYIDEYAKCV
jgi:transcriptional regulator with XRE-family HTH domain